MRDCLFLIAAYVTVTVTYLRHTLHTHSTYSARAEWESCFFVGKLPPPSFQTLGLAGRQRRERQRRPTFATNFGPLPHLCPTPAAQRTPRSRAINALRPGEAAADRVAAVVDPRTPRGRPASPAARAGAARAAQPAQPTTEEGEEEEEEEEQQQQQQPLVEEEEEVEMVEEQQQQASPPSPPPPEATTTLVMWSAGVAGMKRRFESSSAEPPAKQAGLEVFEDRRQRQRDRRRPRRALAR